MTRGTVGITVSDGWLRGCEVAADRPIRVGEIALDPGIVEQGAVVDQAALTAGLRELWAIAGFTGRRVAFGIEAEAAMIRRITLPAMDRAEVAEAVVYDIADVLGFPTDEAVIDFAILDPPDSELSDADGQIDASTRREVEALVVAVRTQVIEAFRHSVIDAGLRWARAELAPAAGVALLGRVELPPGEIGAVVAVGEQTTSIAVHDEIGLLFARVITTGVGSASLSHELESQLADIENLRTGRSNDVSNSQAASAEAPGVAVVAEGVRRTLHYYTSDIDRRPFSSVTLCGPRSRANGLVERLAESLPQVAVHRFTHSGGEPGHGPERFDVALGVAMLAGTTGAPSSASNRQLSLTPAAFVERRRDLRALALGSAIALLIGGVALLDGSRRAESNDREREAVAAGEVTVGRLRAEVARLGEVQAVSAEVDRRRSLLRQVAAGGVDLGAVLGQIAETMPADTSIASIRVTRSAAEIPGSDADGSGGLATLTIDGVASDLDGVGRWVESVSGLTIVQDLWLRQAVTGPFGGEGQVVALFSVDASISDAAADSRASRGESAEVGP